MTEGTGKTSRRGRILVWIVLAMPIVIGASIWHRLPDRMPVHWGISGEVDRYGSRFEGVFLLPLMVIFVNLLFWALPVLDPKKNIARFQPTLRLLCMVITGFLLMLWGMLILNALGYGLAPNTFVPAAVTVLMLVFGNFFGKLKPNYFVGIRTPWTLESERVWIETHRMAGRIWVAASVVMLGLFPFLEGAWVIRFFLGYIFTLVAVPIVHSFLLFRRYDRAAKG